MDPTQKESDKIGEFNFNNLMYYQQSENGLDLQFKFILESTNFESRLDLFAKLGLARTKIVNKDMLKNIVFGSVKTIEAQYLQKDTKNTKDFSLLLELGQIEIDEKVFSTNYSKHKLLQSFEPKYEKEKKIVLEEEESKSQVEEDDEEEQEEEEDELLPSISATIDMQRDENTEQVSIQDISLTISNLKIIDPDKLFAYMSGPLDEMTGIVSKKALLFSPEFQMEVSCEDTYYRIIKKKPYYRTLGQFQLTNGDGLSEGKDHKVEGIVRNQKILFENPDGTFKDLSTTFEAIVEITFTED